MQKQELKKLLYDICRDCHCHDNSDPYCTLMEIMVHAHNDPRFLMQIKCMEKFQYIKAKEFGREVNWDETIKMWIDMGYAAKFAEKYKEDMFVETLFHEVVDK
jgi:hypothetical protein